MVSGLRSWTERKRGEGTAGRAGTEEIAVGFSGLVLDFQPLF